MKQFRQTISLLLAFVLVLGMVPVTAAAEEMVPESTIPETVEIVTDPVKAEDANAHTEPEAEPAVEPTEAETLPVVEATVPEETIAHERVEAEFELLSDAYYSGTCGENLTWEADIHGNLVIRGTGPMDNFLDADDAVPWHIVSGYISAVTIEEGVTSIGDNAFNGFLKNNKMGALESVKIPNSITTIGKSAFFRCEELEHIDLPDSITSIGSSAFAACKKLSSIVLPKNLTSISVGMFSDCTSLRSVSLPVGISEIGRNAFMDCKNLETIEIPDGVIKIIDKAFYGCSSLSSIILPSSLRSIGENAFYGCSSLTDVYFNGTERQWGAITKGTNNQPLVSADIHFEKLVSGTCGDNLKWELNESGTLTIFGEGPMINFTSSPVEKPSWYAYVDQITEIVIQNGVTTIGKYAFHLHEKLQSISLPESLVKIEEGAFYYCVALEEIWIPENVREIGDVIFFHNDSLKKIEVAPENSVYTSAEGVLFIKDMTKLVAYPGGKIGEYVIPETVTEVMAYAMTECNGLTGVYIPAGVTELNQVPFVASQNLKQIIVAHENRVYVSQDGVLFKRSMTELITYPMAKKGSFSIPEGITEISNGAFVSCFGLTEIVLPESLTTIDFLTFKDCVGLKKVVIPKELKSIEEGAFEGCIALTDVYYRGSREEWDALVKSIESRNEPLLQAQLHCNWTSSFTWQAVFFYTRWDADKQLAAMEGGPELLVTEETDPAFASDPTKLLGQYVFVTANAAQAAGTEQDVLVSMEPVKSYVGVVSEADDASVVFRHEDDGQYYDFSYSTPKWIEDTTWYLDKTVLYHLAGGSLLGISELRETEAYLTAWDPDCREIRVKWDGTSLTDSYTLIDGFRPHQTLGYNINAFSDVLHFLDSWDGSKLVIHYLHDDHGHIYDARGEIVDGSFSYIADWGEIASYPFHYDESWFDKDSLVYQHDLARMSLRAAMAAGDSRQLSDKAPYTNIQNLMETLGFDFSETLSQYPDPEYDSIGFAMGHKEIISTAGEHSTLVMVAVRGIGYGAEWGGNFRIGYGITEHEGFKIAADAVLRGLDRYLYELRVQDPDRNIKVWISGFSRGGATTNLVAARLVDGKFSFLDPKDVYAFCFACPKNTTDPNVRSTNYQRIANFINPIDFVPYVAMEGLDFDRYGTDYILPNIEENDNYQYLRDQAHDVYYSILKDGRSPTLAYELATEYMDQSKDQAEVFRKAADSLAHFVKDRKNYTLTYQDVFMGSFAKFMGQGNVEGKMDYLGSAFASLIDNYKSLAFLYIAIDHFIEIVQEGHLTYAHMPTLYLAWMDSLDNLDDEDEGRTSRRLFVNCPVDVAVYRDGTLVGQILGDVPTEIEGGVLTTIDENGQKVVVLPGDGAYDVRLTATGDGEMTYTITERNSTSGNTTRVVSYCDVPIREGDVLNAAVQETNQAADTTYPLTLSDGTEAKPEINLSGSDISTYTVTVLAEGNGAISGGGSYLPGEYARVSVSYEGIAYFVGWFVDGVCVSKDAEYRFLVNADIQLTAKFADTLDALHFTRDYILMAQGQSLPLSVTVSPEELSDRVTWYVEDPGQGILSIDESGTVQALAAGTAYVVAAVSFAEKEFTTRCRVDVAEPIQLEGIQLGTTKLTTELYSTEYAVFNLLLKLPQNISAQSADQKTLTVQNGVAIQDVCFRDAGEGIDLNRLFDLVALDDRRIAVVPTQYALDHAGELSKFYIGTVTAVVGGREYTTEEELTLTVKKNTPKLKGKIDAFNSFYTGQTQEITVTGGTVTKITAKSLPNWLTLNDNGSLSLTADVPAKASGKALLRVNTEQWRIPAEISLSVKASRKDPGLKLSASSVKLTAIVEDSTGVVLKLLAKNKKDTLVSLDVNDILAPEGYRVEDFDLRTGTFLLKTKEGFRAGKVTLRVKINGTEQTVPLTLTVKTEAVRLKTSVKSVALNTALNDTAAIALTATPSDYHITQPAIRLTDSKGADKTGELALSYEDGNVLVSTTAATPTGASYKLYISAGGSKEVSVAVKTVSGKPSVTFKAKSSYDLSFPEKATEVTPNFKNYNGAFTINGMTAETSKKQDVTKQFQASVDGKTILVRAADNTAAGTYTLNLKLKLVDGSICESRVKVTVKRTAVKLKLSATKLSLNKRINDAASVTVTCTTKDYAFRKPVWELSAPGKLDVSYADGSLNVATNAATQYGATYKILVKANAAAPAATLTVTIPAQNKSTVTAALKASGSMDVIRGGKGVTVTPSYKNVMAGTEKLEKLVFYSSADNYAKEVDGLFHYEPNGKGGYIITRADGARLDHTLKYKVQLISVIGSTEVRSAQVAIKVTMGSAKLTVSESTVDLFAQDKNDRATFRLTAKDTALNVAERVEIKDAKYKDLFEIYAYGNGEFAIGFKNGKVGSMLVGKTTSVTLNVWVEGNQTAKVNTTVKLKVNVVK